MNQELKEAHLRSKGSQGEVLEMNCEKQGGFNEEKAREGKCAWMTGRPHRKNNTGRLCKSGPRERGSEQVSSVAC